MEVEMTAQPPSGSGSSSAAYPRWVTLERYCDDSNVDDSSCPTAVARTLATARTSNGHPIQVSLSLAEPPATSSVRVKLLDGGHINYGSITITAHGDSLLVMVNFYQDKCDYFVYSVGDAAADPPRPPSLLLLPPCRLSESQDDDSSRGYPAATVTRQLRINCTGILRRRGDEIVVAEAELQMMEISDDGGLKPMAPKLFLFRSGAWSVKRPRICCGNDGDQHWELPSDWTTSSVLPIGDRILCWADEASDDGGVLICDVLEESPCPQYVPLPCVPSPCFGRKVCATAGGSTLKFVNIFPRCCCGGVGASDCQRSHYAYTINTWTLRMDGGGMDWVMDGMVDATELWSLDAYKGLPRAPLAVPVVSMYEPHVICFTLCEFYHVKYGGDRTLWLLKIDMRSKTIQSVSRHPDWMPGRVLISSNVSYYLNPYADCSSGGGNDGHGVTMSKGQSQTGQMDIIQNQKKKREENDTNLILQSSPCKSSAEPAAQAYDGILAAFREIPSYGLARDDMLKAYAILSRDNNGCRLRSLLRLPMKLRKDWLLMEIKADDA